MAHSQTRCAENYKDFYFWHHNVEFSKWTLNELKQHQNTHYTFLQCAASGRKCHLWGSMIPQASWEKFSLPSLRCSSSCWRRSPSAGVSLPWREPMRSRNTWDHSVQYADSTRQIWRWIKNKDHSLGHLGYVFVSQAHPQVIILMQKNLLLTGVPNATGLIPAGEEDNWHWLTATESSWDYSGSKLCRSLAARSFSTWTFWVFVLVDIIVDG